MTRNHKAMCLAIDKAAAESVVLLEAEAKRIIRKYASLSGFVDSMGTQFFTDRNGKPIDDWRLPTEAGLFIDNMADEHYRYFGSSGLEVRNG